MSLMESTSPENGIEVSSDSNHDKKRKKRNIGAFSCPDCDKVFSRTDHLARHHLNHKPKELFECEFVIDMVGGGKKKCSKTFVRRDLRDRHMQRHVTKNGTRVNWSSVSSVSSHDSFMTRESPQKSIGADIMVDNIGSVGSTGSAGTVPANPANSIVPNSIAPVTNSVASGESPLQISNLIHAAESSDRNSFARPSNLINGIQTNKPKLNGKSNGSTTKVKTEPSQSQSPNPNGFNEIAAPVNANNTTSLTTSQAQTPFSQNFYPKSDMFHTYNVMQSQNDILSWLFNDSSPTNNHNTAGSPPNDSTLKAELTARQTNSPLSVSANPQLLTDTHNGTFNPINMNGTGLNNIRSYDLAESNVFQTESNPLDEVILRNYNQLLHQQYPSETGNNDHNNDSTANNHDGHASGVSQEKYDDRTPFNFNLPSSVSLTSPTNTNDSNPTPRLANDIFSPSSANAQRKLHEYGSKYNVSTNRHIYIDKTILHQLFIALPSLQRAFVELIFNDKVLIEDRFSYYLSVYWLVFHPQFNILHKTSFNTGEAEPLLLLSMILIGCNYCTLPDNPKHLSQPRSKSPEYKLALAIATPLRFAIFQDDAFKSPVRLWVLQSLNLLEWSEKNFLLRHMHERAHVHHGTTVQLMRRSPVLGGNPAANKNSTNSSGTSSDGEEEEDDDDAVATPSNPAGMRKATNKDDVELFKKWVESESMRRVTFMTFYVDIADYVKFRHNPVISFHQLQLMKLPCDDELWEATDVNGSFYKILKKQKKLAISNTDSKVVNPNENFLNIVKKLLKTNGKYVSDFGRLKITPFVKKILFGGLLSIMYQMQQFELQNLLSLISLQTNANFQTWKQIISVAIDNFGLSIGESCKHIKLNKDSRRFIDGGISTCKFPIYHIAQIVALPDLNTYDISIFCGSPANQNVNISLKDRNVVERKLLNIWIKNLGDITNADIVNMKSIIHCFVFLWETLLDSEDGKPKEDIWNPNKDYFDGLFAMSLVMQTLWSYIYLSSGVESIRYNEIQNDIFLLSYERLVDLSAETGYEYLLRIRQEFLTNLRKDNLHHSYSIDKLYRLDNTTDNGTVITPHEVVVKYCSILSRITNKQNISGLCFLIGSKLYNSQWEPVRENGKLIINCGFRSIGKTEVLCSDVFDVELLD